MLVLNKVECFLHRGWEEGGGGGVRRKVGEEGLRGRWGRRGWEKGGGGGVGRKVGEEGLREMWGRRGWEEGGGGGVEEGLYVSCCVGSEHKFFPKGTRMAACPPFQANLFPPNPLVWHCF